MSTLDPLHPLQGAIIELLAASPGLTVKEVYQAVHKRCDTSLPNLYRLLSQLLEHQILVRSKSRLALNRVWAASAVKLAETLRKNYLGEEGHEIDVLVEEGQPVELGAESLLALDPVWNDVLLRLKSGTDERNWYAYNSHPWYSIGMPDTERRLYQGLYDEGIKTCLTYGSDTFLDRYGQRLIKAKGFSSRIRCGLPFPPEGYALWICGSYLVECSFPNAIARQFSFFFRTVNAVEEFDPELFSGVFRMRARCTLKISKNGAQAAAWKKVLRFRK